MPTAHTRALHSGASQHSTCAPGTLRMPLHCVTRSFSDTCAKYGLDENPDTEEQILPRKRPKIKPRAIIRNLDPRNLALDDLLDLSGRKSAPTMFQASGDPSHKVLQNLHYYYDKGNLPFPPDTKGFLYFQYRPEVHVAAGGLRFRVVNPNLAHLGPAAMFEKGRDLMKAPFAPWGTHLVTMASHSKYRRPILDLAVRQGLLPRDALGHIRTLIPNGRNGLRLRGIEFGNIVENVLSPFIFDFNALCPSALLLHEEVIKPHYFSRLQVVYPMRTSPGAAEVRNPSSGKHSAISPVNREQMLTADRLGKALVRFEVVPSPDPKHEGAPRLVIRVLQFIEPPNPNDVLMQKEGELLQQYDYRTKTQRPWMSYEYKCLPRYMTPSSMRLLVDTYMNKR